MALSLCQRYHEFTKYSPEGLARSNHQLDWSQQPVPFKDYPVEVSTTLDLKPYLKQTPDAGQTAVDVDGLAGEEAEAVRWQRQRLSQMLFFSYGVTLTLSYPRQLLYLRTAPSAGGLYPAEIYVIANTNQQIVPAGIYNYQVKDHTLVRLWDDPRWVQLQQSCWDSPILQFSPLVLVTTVVFFRSAWRYQDRAYRRVCLDTGHLLGNIELAANLTGFRASLLGGFADQQLADLLFLNFREESPLSVIPLQDLWRDAETDVTLYPDWQRPPQSPTALPSSTYTESVEFESGEWLFSLHQHSCLQTEPLVPPKRSAESTAGNKYNFPFCLKAPTGVTPISWGGHLQQLVQSMLRRRSTREFTQEPLELTDLLCLLDFTYHPEHYEDQGMDPDPDFFDLTLIETFVVVNSLSGLEEGCYYYAPQVEELRQIRFKNFREEVHHLCLGQNLGRDAAAVIFHTADLDQAVQRYGERAYRYLHMDAGHLGQRLNLAAVQLNIGVSGIAGFFDDQVNEVLGIPVSEAVLYITTLGHLPNS
jgi:SagB-type dehydrogenase family enzyme